MTLYRFSSVRIHFVCIAATLACAPENPTRAADNTAKNRLEHVDVLNTGDQTTILTNVDDRWNFRFKNQRDRSIHFSADEILSWGQLREPSPRCTLLLRDGSFFVLPSRNAINSISSKSATIATRFFGSIEVSRKDIQAIIFDPQNTKTKAAIQLHRLRNASQATPDVGLINGDTIQGSLIEMTKQVSKFKHENRAYELPTNQIRVIQFHPPLPRRAESFSNRHALIGLKDGSQLLAKSMQLTGRRLRLNLLHGPTLTTLPFVRPTEAKLVCMVMPMSGRVQYLSDHKPISYKHIPYLTLEWPYRMNQNLFSDWLRLEDTIVAKGIAMHSMSRLAFRVPPDAERFVADLALDRSAKSQGNVVYRVFLEKGAKWTQAFESQQISSSTKATRCLVDVRDATGMALVVDFADRADQFDHANWLKARWVMKRQSRSR